MLSIVILRVVWCNVISWKNKKQNVVVRSFTKANYKPMASLTCELVKVNQFLQELDFCDMQLMKIHCDNQDALPPYGFHERTKYIEIDCNFIWEKLLCKETYTKFVGSNNQLVDVLTKTLRGHQIESICSKLSTYNCMLQHEREC